MIVFVNPSSSKITYAFVIDKLDVRLIIGYGKPSIFNLKGTLEFMLPEQVPLQDAVNTQLHFPLYAFILYLINDCRDRKTFLYGNV